MMTGMCWHMSDYLRTLQRTGVDHAIDYQYQISQLIHAKVRKNKLDETLYIVV